MIVVMCPLCADHMRVSTVEGGYGRYVIHFIEKHWEIVTKVHETTGDGKARERLNQELNARLRRKMN